MVGYEHKQKGTNRREGPERKAVECDYSLDRSLHLVIFHTRPASSIHRYRVCYGSHAVFNIENSAHNQ